MDNKKLVEKFIKKFKPKKDKNTPQYLEDMREYIVRGTAVEEWLKKVKD